MALRVSAPQAFDGQVHPPEQKFPVLRQTPLERKGVGLVRPVVDGRNIQQGQEAPALAQSLRKSKTLELPSSDPGWRAPSLNVRWAKC